MTALAANPHRPFTAAERTRRNMLEAFLNTCSEDQLIEDVLLPLLRQLGFQRITAAGHKDKAQEYGKDVWMRYTLPSGLQPGPAVVELQDDRFRFHREVV